MRESCVPKGDVPSNSNKEIWKHRAGHNARSTMQEVAQAHKDPEYNVVNESSQQDILVKR
jgi:hypothetical protein